MTPSTMLSSTASRSLRSRVRVRSLSSSSAAIRFIASATAANSTVDGTSSLLLKSPSAKRSAPSRNSRMGSAMRRETYQPSSAATSATTAAPAKMLVYRRSRASLTVVSGMAVRTTALT